MDLLIKHCEKGSLVPSPSKVHILTVLSANKLTFLKSHLLSIVAGANKSYFQVS